MTINRKQKKLAISKQDYYHYKILWKFRNTKGKQLIHFQFKPCCILRSTAIYIMKKIKFQKKLSLNKETITKLNEDQMNQVKGGRRSSPGRSVGYCLVGQNASLHHLDLVWQLLVYSWGAYFPTFRIRQ